MNENEMLRRIEELEKENKYLKSLLNHAGIPYTQISASQKANANFVPNQSERIIPIEVNYNNAQKFFSYFWGRMDVFAKRHENKNTGKVGYYPQCNNFWKEGLCPRAAGNKIKCKECKYRKWTNLQPIHIEAHLRGKKEDGSDVVGVYPLHMDGTCRFMVFDFDNHNIGAEDSDFANDNDLWKEEVDTIRKICAENEIPTLVERSRSGRGAHVWIFFNGPISAKLVHEFGVALLEKGAQSVNLKSFRYYDRMLPAQTEVSNEELGNLIALPLQGQALKAGNSAFIDENWNAIPNQWSTLISTKRLSSEEIEQLMEKWNVAIQDDKEITLLNDGSKPWDRTMSFNKLDVEGTMQIILADRIYISTDNLKPRIQNQIRRMAAFSNPIFFKNKSMGLSNYDQTRFIYLGEDDNGYICIPRGLKDKLEDKCKESSIEIHYEDKRSVGRKINVKFTGQLRDNQEIAINKLSKYDNGILNAATAFGKTVACSKLIAEKKVSTLILLESSSLIEQWKNTFNKFLDIDEELPEYQTQKGRIKKRDSVIGIIQGSKDTSTGIIDIAMAGSLIKKGEPHRRLKEYGMVIVDECHHSASDTLSSVLNEVTAKYVYGVTATVPRGDGLEKINYMLLGPIRYQYTAKEKAKDQGIPHLIVPRFTRTVYPHGRERIEINDAYELIRDSEIRNKQILDDIKHCIEEGRTPVVLTKYTKHASVLYQCAKEYADKVFLLTGEKSKKEQKSLRKEMDAVSKNESMLLIATGQLIGEGFDYPRLDTLIMAMPVAWKGIVEQYAGRLNRDYEGKENVIIYDYIDSHIPVFDRMYAKRLKAYKNIGYQLAQTDKEQKQEANAIFDFETYIEVYEKDLLEAKTDIVISSPTLGKDKVYRMIKLLKERQEVGVKVTIITWHPDAYRYGKEVHRIELMEELRNSGFNIELVEEHCEHYAVIDSSIVWYGSMNLLSKDDVEDNIMRVESKEIAAELLQMTFKKENNIQMYKLPI